MNVNRLSDSIKTTLIISSCVPDEIIDVLVKIIVNDVLKEEQISIEESIEDERWNEMK